MSAPPRLGAARWLLSLALSWWALLIICAVATAASADPRLATHGNAALLYAAGASGILAVAKFSMAARARGGAGRAAGLGAFPHTDATGVQNARSQ